MAPTPIDVPTPSMRLLARDAMPLARRVLAQAFSLDMPEHLAIVLLAREAAWTRGFKPPGCVRDGTLLAVIMPRDILERTGFAPGTIHARALALPHRPGDLCVIVAEGASAFVGYLLDVDPALDPWPRAQDAS